MKRLIRINSSCLIVALVTCSGCTTSKSQQWKFVKGLDVRRAIGLKSDEPPSPEIPARIVSSWTDTVLSKAGQKPIRGFGGRLTFFGRGHDSPVRVDGQLVVYAFEETDDHAVRNQLVVTSVHESSLCGMRALRPWGLPTVSGYLGTKSAESGRTSASSHALSPMVDRSSWVNKQGTCCPERQSWPTRKQTFQLARAKFAWPNTLRAIVRKRSLRPWLRRRCRRLNKA